jgi:alanine-glyoxylate transaminase / serine-glyoxylate transaminase / serine-pyruvate transaminase
MPVKRGRKFLNTPGPTNVPESVLNAMHRNTMDLSDPDFLDVAISCFSDMQKVFKTEGTVFIYTCNGHGAWEAALTNTLSPGDKVLVPETGNFSNSWSDMARALGIVCESLPNDWRVATSPANVRERLARDPGHEIKAVLLVHTDTATSITSDVKAVRKAIDDAGHPALLMVDTVASLGTVDFRMDEWKVDVAVAASQKGLMMAPGLGFVAASEKAVAAHATSKMPRRYWDWEIRLQQENYRWFCGTAPQLLVFGLREALDLLLEEGLDQVFERHQVLADATRAAVSQWALGNAVSFNAVNPKERSNAVTTILLPDGVDGNALRTTVRDEMMVGLGGGLGKLNGKAFRIGHMGDLNAPMLYGALASVESVLAYMDVPIQKGGVTAAIDVITAEKKAGRAKTL